MDHVPSGADSVPTGLSNTTDEGVGCYTIFVGAFGILMAALLLVVGIDSLDGSNYDPACVERAERSYADTRTTLQYNGPTAGNKKDYTEAVCG
ncbi:hypothetical protein [Nocardioides aquiterrae]|uniref:hypothetical protein n=1 Tax=Nocardioides aquiterrae TaxID=203799 RepID=UPI0031CEAC84